MPNHLDQAHPPRNRFFAAIARARGADLSAPLCDIADATQRIATAAEGMRADEPDHAATLYAGGVGPDGEFTDNRLGDWLRQAGYNKLHDVIKGTRRESHSTRRKTFIEKMKNVAHRFGDSIAKEMSEIDLGHFFDTAPYVHRTLEASRRAPSRSSDDDPTGQPPEQNEV